MLHSPTSGPQQSSGLAAPLSHLQKATHVHSSRIFVCQSPFVCQFKPLNGAIARCSGTNRKKMSWMTFVGSDPTSFKESVIPLSLSVRILSMVSAGVSHAFNTLLMRLKLTSLLSLSRARQYCSSYR